MLWAFLTPYEYVETLRKMYGICTADLELHLSKFGELFNGEVLGKQKYIRDLSKGNLKKVGIAAALLGPEISTPRRRAGPATRHQASRGVAAVLALQSNPQHARLKCALSSVGVRME